MLFSANERAAVSTDFSPQNQSDLSVNCETRYKYALGFRVRIITTDSWQELYAADLFIVFVI
jgi:hypothetical protein